VAGARRAPLKDRLFSLLCFAGAVLVLVVGLSRGNPRAAFIGAGVLVGYAVLQDVSRRLTPGARLLSGSEADERERRVQMQATRLAGQVAVLLTGLGVLAALLLDWTPGLWVAGASTLVVVAFVGGLWFYHRASRAV
jgi:uncharacterized membrane protein